jgi:hypothetical protein
MINAIIVSAACIAIVACILGYMINYACQQCSHFIPSDTEYELAPEKRTIVIGGESVDAILLEQVRTSYYLDEKRNLKKNEHRFIRYKSIDPKGFPYQREWRFEFKDGNEKKVGHMINTRRYIVVE